MRLPRRMRIWGVPVGHLWTAAAPDESADVVAEMPDPDASPAPPNTAEVDQEVIIERLDVPPERRPWDVDVPPRDPAPRRDDKPIVLPHCNGRHGPRPDDEGDPCDWCDALADLITSHRALERRVTELERQAADLVELADRRVMDGRRS